MHIPVYSTLISCVQPLLFVHFPQDATTAILRDTELTHGTPKYMPRICATRKFFELPINPPNHYRQTASQTPHHPHFCQHG
jgi:hypothetical protein